MNTPYNTNYSLTIKSPGNLDSLSFVTMPRVPLSEDEVEIEVFATALNFKEILYALGMLPLPPAESFYFGLECVGKINAIGAKVNKFQPGDQVMAFAANALSAFVNVKENEVIPIPTGCKFLESATIPIPFLTAYYALNVIGQLKERESVLIHAATGGVGLAAIQVAQACGAHIFVTAGTQEKHDYLRSIGIHNRMSSRTLEFADQILEITNGRGVDVVLNSLSGDFLQKSLLVVAENGRFIELGKRDILQNTALGLGLFNKNLTFSSVNISTNLPYFEKCFQEILSKFTLGIFKPLPYKIYSKDQIAEAFKYMARSNHIGRVIITHQPLSAFEDALPLDNQALDNQDSHQLEGLSTQQGCDIFEQILSLHRPQVIVSTKRITERMELYASRQNVNVKNEFVTEYTKKYHERPELPVAYLSPRSELETKLSELWQQFFKIKPIGIHDNFFELGGDSLLAVQLIAELHTTLAIQLPAHSLIEAPTIAQLTTMLTTTQDHDISPQIVKLNTTPNQKRKIFMIHPVGGTVYLYNDLASLLQEFAVFGIQANTIVDEKQVCPATIEAFASEYIKLLLSIQPEGPYILGGASFGGLVAYEMAQQLRGQSQNIQLIFMLDTAMRDQLTADKLKDDLSILIYLTRALNPDVKLPIAYLQQLSYEEQLRYFIQESHLTHKLLPDLPVDKLKSYLQLFRTNLLSILLYQPQPYQGDLLFFKATEHDAYNAICPEASWVELVQERMKIFQVGGNHTTMNFKPHVNLVAHKIIENLN